MYLGCNHNAILPGCGVRNTKHRHVRKLAPSKHAGCTHLLDIRFIPSILEGEEPCESTLELREAEARVFATVRVALSIQKALVLQHGKDVALSHCRPAWPAARENPLVHLRDQAIGNASA